MTEKCEDETVKHIHIWIHLEAVALELFEELKMFLMFLGERLGTGMSAMQV